MPCVCIFDTLQSVEASNEKNTPDDSALEKYAARTRRSLIARLQDWKDQRSWDEFYRTYWRLIYSVATKSGLSPDEAWDTVQETVLSVARQTREKQYDPAKGSFKMWLWHIIRWRIKDQFRKRLPITAEEADSTESPAADVENLADLSGDTFDKIWEREWQQNILKAATERVKMKTSPRQFQIFDYLVLRGMSTADVRSKLGVSIAQIYLAKHRVGGLLRREIEYIRAQGDTPAAPQDANK